MNKPLQILTLIKKFMKSVMCMMTLLHVLQLGMKFWKVLLLVISFKPKISRMIIVNMRKTVIAKDLIPMMKALSYLIRMGMMTIGL